MQANEYWQQKTINFTVFPRYSQGLSRYHANIKTMDNKRTLWRHYSMPFVTFLVKNHE